MTDSRLAAERGECRVRQIHTLGDQLLVDSDQVSAAEEEELTDPLTVLLRPRRPEDLRHARGARRQHYADGTARDP